MAKIVDITGHTWQPSEHGEIGAPQEDEDKLSEIDNSVFWIDPPAEEQVEVMTKLPPARIAAIIVKGCFALYHLAREHRRRRTPVPAYLLGLAREHENPLIPAAEALYVEYFEDGCWPDDIPGNLLEIGSSTVDHVGECTRHALRLHRLLKTFGAAGRTAQQEFYEMFPTDEGAMLLMQVMIARHRSAMTTRNHLKSV